MTSASDSGLLICDKPQGWTSHQVVGRVRRLMGTRKVGHAGTLDPMATGVLIIGVNRATRLLGHLALHDKRYEATIRLGQSTTTDDAEGEPSGGADAGHLTRELVEAELPAFRGVIQQVPSSVSAIKVNGQRAYKLVRDGEQVELKSREVTITRYEVLGLRQVDLADGTRGLDVDVEVEASSGTYIRALARDLGAALGVGGHLTALRRTRIGGYNLVDLPVVDLECDDRPQLLGMAEAARLSFPVVQLDEDQARDVGFGRSLRGLMVPGSPTGVLAPDGELLALYRPDEEDPSIARPIAVLA
ncbi:MULTISPECIES: tRNA pseudouridine(55) synthase TruB [unclassified Luteococcus]|uniref:tRNA pseudouridine(55) synthase TruB n=1 Tax=unclassified Luteococcus TaxID=2639923 RepID=UPI00313D825A